MLSRWEGYVLQLNGHDILLLDVFHDSENYGLLSIDFRDNEALTKALASGGQLPPVKRSTVDDNDEIHVY